MTEPDQTTPVTDEDRRAARKWAEWAVAQEGNSGRTSGAAARVILAEIPAPPKSLADELRRFGAEYLSESLEDKLSVLADLAEALEHNREEWREAYREARTIAEGHLASIKHREERIETLTAERDAARNSEAEMQEQFNQMYEQSQKITNQRDESRDRADRLKRDLDEAYETRAARADEVDRLNAEVSAWMKVNQAVADQHETTVAELDSARAELQAVADILHCGPDQLLTDVARKYVAELDEWAQANHTAVQGPTLTDLADALRGRPVRTDPPAPADTPEDEMWLIKTDDDMDLAGVRDADGRWSVLSAYGYAQECALDDDQVTLVARLVPDVRRVIDKAEDLDALPVMSVVLADGKPAVKRARVRWWFDGVYASESDLVTYYGTVTVLYVPEVTA